MRQDKTDKMEATPFETQSVGLQTKNPLSNKKKSKAKNTASFHSPRFISRSTVDK